MKKLLTLSFVVLFVAALSSLTFAQTLVVESEADEVVLSDAVQPDCCSNFGHAPFRPFFRGYYASHCGSPCYNPCQVPCPPQCSFAFQRPVIAPQYDCVADPCAYPAYGYRAPIRGFFSRVFAPRYYDSSCCY